MDKRFKEIHALCNSENVKGTQNHFKDGNFCMVNIMKYPKVKERKALTCPDLHLLLLFLTI